ncbi:MAG: DEAD/DEAH box helicase [Pseudomonadota bacterium]|nr:DEAD/DEAH box helicase [Pseudomonadota bacterium]
MSLTFSDFALADSLKQALADLGFSEPTSVQQAAVPAALEGKDLLVSSKTGSGKTVAFLLPALNPLALVAQPPMSVRAKAIVTPSVLVLCPTRELAQQVSQDAINLVRHVRGVRIASIMGGMPFGKQIAQMKGAQVIVATPGRLLDLVNRRQLSLDEVKTLILDEADRMLDLGFSEDLEAISDLANNREQTLMFSATFADRILRLAEKLTNNPERIAIESAQTTNIDIAQTLHWTDGFEHKKKLLNHWLNDESVNQAVVFASTQSDTDLLAEELAEMGHQVVSLHGAMPQAVRNRRIRTLREGRARVLVATDVAARGLDVPAISHVINFGLPMKNEDYVHRIGRTGRAGRSGQAITLATHRERSKVRSLEDYLKSRLPVSEIAGLEPSPPPETPRRANGRGGYAGSGAGRRRPEGERNFRSGAPAGRGGEGRSAGGYRGDNPRAAAPAADRAQRYNDDNRGNRADYRGEAPRGESRTEQRPWRDASAGAPRGQYNRDGAAPRPAREYGQADSRGERPRRDYQGQGAPRPAGATTAAAPAARPERNERFGRQERRFASDRHEQRRKYED